MNLQEKFKDELQKLSPRERDVIRLRFGMDDGRMRTLQEIGELFGVSRERIRQILEKGLRKTPSIVREMAFAFLYNTILESIFHKKIWGICSIDYEELKKDINNILNKDFSEDEIKIFNLMFGISSGSQKNVKEIAQELNITEEQASQLESKVLRKLRHPKRNESLRKYLPVERVRKPLPNIDEELLNIDLSK